MSASTGRKDQKCVVTSHVLNTNQAGAARALAMLEMSLHPPLPYLHISFISAAHLTPCPSPIYLVSALTTLLVKAIRDSGGGGLVGHAKDLHTRYDAAVLGGLVLGVIKVRGEGDHGGVRDFVSNVSLGGLRRLDENHGADLRRCLHRVNSVMLDKNMEGLSTYKVVEVATVLDLDGRLPCSC